MFVITPLNSRNWFHVLNVCFTICFKLNFQEIRKLKLHFPPAPLFPSCRVEAITKIEAGQVRLSFVGSKKNIRKGTQ